MGVKSLWTLLSPIGRPVMLETVEGKVMAIDSSIWLYQFQATMRDKEGRSLVNAHVLGFLRRISKLLFYGIKPVFVFDGGAPALKRTTLSERKKKKMGAASTHIKLAEKLLAAQMRREAVNQARNNRSKNGKNRHPDDVLLADDTVYMEDIDGSAPKTPAKRKLPTPSSSSTKKTKFRDHDPYNLPHIDMDDVITKATRASAPDPRLATEDELRTFIEQMRPEDFDVNSPDFRELPTEVQYEIIGDLRLKSRQTSYARLQKMLKNAPTPLDFSKQQIKNLRQRNALTQQLLMTTDSIGTANIAIPVRIASERNREYILMKNEGVDGGWILGIKDTGTREKPIVLDHEDPASEREDEDSDEDMEEVQVPIFDEDPDQPRRETTILKSSPRDLDKDSISSAPVSMDREAMFATHSRGLDKESGEDLLIDDFEDDMLAYVIQESLDSSEVRKTDFQSKNSNHDVSTSRSLQDGYRQEYTPHSRLETALSIANTGTTRVQGSPLGSGKVLPVFGEPGEPTILSSDRKSSILSSEGGYQSQTEDFELVPAPERTENDGGPPVVDVPDDPSIDRTTLQAQPKSSRVDHGSIFGQPNLLTSSISTTSLPSLDSFNSYDNNLGETSMSTSDENLDKGYLSPGPRVLRYEPSVVSTIAGNAQDNGVFFSSSTPVSDDDMEEIIVATIPSPPLTKDNAISPHLADSRQRAPHDAEIHQGPPEQIMGMTAPGDSIEHDEVLLSSLARTPPHDTGFRPHSPYLSEEDWDLAKEMNMNEEEGEFARFMSQVKGRDMDEVRKEIDAEINDLNQQRKNAIRDSDDITQQMIAQIMIMLRLFGIPYITAPMEAEAQCAELVSLALVDGVITDDSDVFLFGAQRVYKNMFNQSKTVECFLLSDLSRELGLDRDALINLAYLLGSDYTEGLPGVGPVVAMELLEEFPGFSGLHNFKDWWVKVQSGKDRPEDSQSKFRKQFKKKFKNLYLADDWPNSVVRDAYYHPTVDSSEEPFKWGMPDLDGLRSFLHQELGWQKPKVDELLLPIIQKINKRNQAAAMNKQGNLNEFLDISVGSGTHAPRQSLAYQSKRLQQVISDFRKRRKNASDIPSSGSRSPFEDNDKGEGSSGRNSGELPPVKKRRTRATGSRSTKGKEKTTAIKPDDKNIGGSTRTKGRGSQRQKDISSRPGSDGDDMTISDDEDDDDFIPLREDEALVSEMVTTLRPRPRPRPVLKKRPRSPDNGSINKEIASRSNSE